MPERKTNVVWNLIKIIFAIALVWYFLSWVNLEELHSLWTKVQVSYLVLTVVLYATLTLFKAYIYQQILIQQKTRYPRVLNIVVVQNAISNFLANSAGIASYIALLRFEENVKVRQSGLTFIIVKIGDLFAVWVVSILCSIALWGRVAELHNALLFFLVLVGVGFVVFFIALFSRKGFITLMDRILISTRLIRYSFFERVITALKSFAEMDQRIVFGIVLKTFVLTFGYYLVTLAWMIVSMNAFRLPVDWLSIVFVSCILQLFSMIPISVFGGLGITEVTSLYLYTLLGAPHTELSIVLVGWRILYYVTNLLLVGYLPIYALFIEPRMSSE